MLITHFSKPRFIVLLCLILWSPLLAPEAASQTRGWGETLSIYFRAGSADYDSAYLDNGKRLEEYLSKIQSVISHNEASSVKISVSIDTPPVPYVSSAFRPAAPVASVSAPQVIIDRKVSPLITLPKDYFVGIKTNLLYDFASVTNVSIEVGYAKHYSFELLGTFSPWDYGRETLQFRTALLQPEFRYWFSEGWTRHFVGLHAHLGWYNIAPGGKVRYQDHNGNSPLVGVGLSYGYVVPFTSHWGAEFSVGAGYAYLLYDKFYNIHNGAQFGTGEKHYFGLTKLGASVYYRF